MQKFLTTPSECKYREAFVMYKLETGELPEMCNADEPARTRVAFPATLTERFGLVGFREMPTGVGFHFVHAETEERLSVVFWYTAESAFAADALYRTCLLTTQPLEEYGV